MTDNNIYYIEKILDKRRVNGKCEYKIKWEGYPLNQSTWEPLENLQTAIELVNEYDRMHPLQGKSKNDFIHKKREKKEVKSAEKGKIEKEKKEEKIEKIPLEEEKKPNNENNNGIIHLDEEEEDEHKRKFVINDTLKSVVTVRKKDNKLNTICF